MLKAAATSVAARANVLIDRLMWLGRGRVVEVRAAAAAAATSAAQDQVATESAALAAAPLVVAAPNYSCRGDAGRGDKLTIGVAIEE